MVESKQSEHGLANPGIGLVSSDEQQQTEVKKTALRDLQNDNRMVSLQNINCDKQQQITEVKKTTPRDLQNDNRMVSPQNITCDKQQPITEVKKTAPRDLQNDNRMVTPQNINSDKQQQMTEVKKTAPRDLQNDSRMLSLQNISCDKQQQMTEVKKTAPRDLQNDNRMVSPQHICCDKQQPMTEVKKTAPRDFQNDNRMVSLQNISCDKQQQMTEVKKTAPRDLQNDNRMVSPPTVPNRGTVGDVIKVSGFKRPTPECPMGLPSRQAPSSNGTNGNLVYIRRKSEHEVERSNTCDHVENIADCPQIRQSSHGIHETSRQQVPLQGPKGYSAFSPISGASISTYAVGGPSVPLSSGNPVNALPATNLNHSAVTSGINPVNSQRKSDLDFKERFLRLQAFLKSYDDSSNDEYIQMLRSLPSVSRSKHAVQLEKRAIHLLLEEKQELERMKALNVLGKSAPKENSSPATTTQALPGK